MMEQKTRLMPGSNTIVIKKSGAEKAQNNWYH